jgi:hypothetical protein
MAVGLMGRRHCTPPDHDRQPPRAAAATTRAAAAATTYYTIQPLVELYGGCMVVLKVS